MVLALLAAPAAGQTPLVDVPASADGPVHFSQAAVTLFDGASARWLYFTSSTAPPASDVLPVMGRGFGLVAATVTTAGHSYPNTWLVQGAASISASDRAELAVVVVGPAGTTPRVARLSDTANTVSTSGPTSVYYIGPVVSWAAQAYSDLGTGAADGDAGLRRRRYGRDSRPGARPAARRRRRPGRAAGVVRFRARPDSVVTCRPGGGETRNGRRPRPREHPPGARVTKRAGSRRRVRTIP